ncbi:DUF5131 family protein [Eubacterium maltosivorans]|uniref:DUF5131 family protein n=1 Tax=Eubacterium maltosivorans TaxID=2041044 RepID=UPI0026C53C77
MSITWNPWHGCQKISAGCQNCYVYRMDEKYNRDSHQVSKNSCFNLLLKKNGMEALKSLQAKWFIPALPPTFFWTLPTPGGQRYGR